MRNGLQDSGVNSYSYQTYTFCRQQKKPPCPLLPMRMAGGGGGSCGCGGGPVVSEKVEVQVYKYERCTQNGSPCQQKCSSQQKATKCDRSRLAAKQNKCKKFGISGSISKTRNFGKRNAKNQCACPTNFLKFSDCRPKESNRKRCRRQRAVVPCGDTQLALEKALQYLPIGSGGATVCLNGPDNNSGGWASNCYSSSARYQQPSSSGASAAPGTYPFEADFQQPLQGGGAANYANYQQASTYAAPQMPAYAAAPPQQTVEYRTISQPLSQVIAAQAAAQAAQAGAEQLQQMNDYQQEQLQAQMQAQQQQRQQEQLLMDLYKQTPQGQGRAVTDSPAGRSQAFYTADQYINFLNRQHQDVFSQQQNQPDQRGYQFSPMSAYTNGVSASTAGAQGAQYSPASNVSHVNYSNGKLSYNF